MKSKSSAKVSSKSTTAPKAKSAPKANGALDFSVATLVTRVAPKDEMDAKVLLAGMRERITPELRSTIEAKAAAELTVVKDVGMPLHIYASEAISAAVRVEWHQVPREGVSVTLAPHRARLGGDVAAELVYLVDQMRIADSMIEQGRAPLTEKVIERGRQLITRIRAAAEVVVDDGVRDDKNKVVEALRRAHLSSPGTIAAVASALAAYVDAGRLLSNELANLAGFDMAMLDEGAELADTLSARKTVNKNEGNRTARLRRGRLLKLIRDRLAKLGKIARFAFAAYPEVVREFFSAFNREQRRAKGRGAAEEDDLDTPEPEPTDGTDDEPAPTPEPSDDPV